jgi:hypothetical protein
MCKKVIRVNRILPICLLIVLLFGMIGCGTVASIRPIGKGKSSLTFSSGGPVVPAFGIDMPIPYAVLRYRRGLNENTDFHFGSHITPLIFADLGMDVGITKHILPQCGWRPALSLGGSLYGFLHTEEFSSMRVYPEISVIGSYLLSRRGLALYFGTHNMMQLDSPYLILAPFLGFEIPIGSKLGINLEAKWYAPTEDSKNRPVQYTFRPSYYGALGFVWGLSYKF